MRTCPIRATAGRPSAAALLARACLDALHAIIDELPARGKR